MQGESQGSQWDIIMNVIVDSGKFLNKNTYRFSGELSTIDYLNQTEDISCRLRQWLSKLKEKRSRSSALSNLYRQEGNAFYREVLQPRDLAADYFTKAIFSAPKNSIELALAHANRAACSKYQMVPGKLIVPEVGYYDCQMALQFGYPMRKRHKLLARKFDLSNDDIQRIDTLREMEEMVKRKLFTEADMKLPLYRKQCDDRMKNNASTSESKLNKQEAIIPESIASKHKQMIERYDESVGRYIVAGEAIKKNELILCEKAFSFVPVYNDYDPNSISYHCQNCAKTNCTPFPCYECVRASYCSPFCLEQHKSIHKYECNGYQKNLWVKIGIAHLAFRNFIVGFFDSIQMLEDAEVSSPERILLTLVGIHQTDFVYGDVLRLITNFDKMEADDILRYALTAQLLAIYLEDSTDFFVKIPDKCKRIMPKIENWKKLAAAMLMRHMGQLVSNGHAISDIELLPPSLCDFSYRDDGSISVYDLHLVTSINRIFTAIFPQISLLNHSCDPNIRNSFDGAYLKIYASNDIAENSEIFNCYGPNYKLMSKDNRQLTLKQQYCFTCNCERCLSNDKTYEKYYEYVCPNMDCCSSIQLNGSDHQWWNQLEIDAGTSPFECDKCKKPLLLNPHTLREFFELIATENHVGFSYYRHKPKTEKAIAYYMNVSKCLSKHHELKAIMAQYVLKYQMHADKEDMFTRLAYIAMENYVITRERFGQYSLEVIMSITYALNILKLAKELEKESSKHQEDIAKIRKVLDIKKMERSISILSDRMQPFFIDAIEEITIPDTDRVDERMLKLVMSSDSEPNDESDNVD